MPEFSKLPPKRQWWTSASSEELIATPTVWDSASVPESMEMLLKALIPLGLFSKRILEKRWLGNC
jgi:hypothetical protein